MTTVKPFIDDDREYTRIHNFMFDVLMPALSPTAFKILALIVRKTKGWRLESEQLSYLDIMKGTGIKSATTVSAGLKELLELKCIAVTHGTTWQKNTYSINVNAEYTVTTSENGVQIATPKNGAGTTPENGVAPTPENGVFNRKKEISPKKTITTTMGAASAAGGGGSPGDCSWKTETYRYLMQIHHQYPTVFKQPNGKNAKKYAELPLALVQKITEECVAHGLGTGLLMNKLQGALDFPPPPPVEAAPADDTPEPEIIPPPFMPMDEWAQIVSPFEREVWALTVYRDGVLTTDSTLDRHINYDYAARRDRILARIGGGA